MTTPARPTTPELRRPVIWDVMRRGNPSLKRLALLVFIVVPALAWAVVRPVRVLAPELAGVVCVGESLCMDDPSQEQRARALYDEAVTFVGRNIAVVEGRPRIVFCATPACAQSFGLGARSAVTLATFGTVVGPRAWQPHYVRHELIHYVQARRLGVAGVLLRPSWFLEGMAYGLSADPRKPLAEPFESYRARFLHWYGSIDKTRLWQEAQTL